MFSCVHGAELVRMRSSASLPIDVFVKQVVPGTEFRDGGLGPSVLPAIKGALGFCDVKWGDEWVWLLLLLRAAYGAVFSNLGSLFSGI